MKVYGTIQPGFKLKLEASAVSADRLLCHGEPGAEQVLWLGRRAERVRQIEENALSKLPDAVAAAGARGAAGGLRGFRELCRAATRRCSALRTA
jgi:hypothetical protein